VTVETAIWVAVGLPFLGAIGVMVAGGVLKSPNLRDFGITTPISVATFIMVLQIVPSVLAGHTPEYVLVADVLPGIDIAFEVEPLGLIYALVASGLWIPTGLYGIGYMRGHDEKNQTRFFICFPLAIMAALGIAFSKNLFTLFLFYEILTFSTYPLVTHYENDEAKRAGRIYLGILVSTSVAFLLFAIVLTQHYAGTLDFVDGGILAGKVEGWALIILLALFAFGTGKAALMPFHRWLPAAMVAPTPVSALLHAVAIVKAGVFTVLKIIVYIFGIDLLAATDASVWLMYVAGFTLMASSIVALTKDNLKARLAYSTISQLSYIVLGGALATAYAVKGAGMHIAMHAVGKITLFFCAGAIYVAHHKKNISDMHGIGRKMPFTMAAFFLGSVCIIGLPPTGGSWSKWYLALGAIEADQLIFVVLLMISSLLSIGYLMPVVVKAFFYEPSPDDHHHHEDDGHDDDGHDDHGHDDHGHDDHGDDEHGHDDHGHDDHAEVAIEGGFWANISEAPMLCVVPLCVTAVGCIAMFFYAEWFYDLLALIGTLK